MLPSIKTSRPSSFKSSNKMFSIDGSLLLRMKVKMQTSFTVVSVEVARFGLPGGMTKYNFVISSSIPSGSFTLPRLDKVNPMMLFPRYPYTLCMTGTLRNNGKYPCYLRKQEYTLHHHQERFLLELRVFVPVLHVSAPQNYQAYSESTKPFQCWNMMPIGQVLQIEKISFSYLQI